MHAVLGWTALGLFLIAGMIMGPVLWKKWQIKNAATTPSTSATPQTPKRTFGWGWLIALVALVIAGLLIWKVPNWHKPPPVSNAVSAPSGEHCKWTWKTHRGRYVHGRTENAPDETEAEIVRSTPDQLWFDIHYLEYGSPETERVRLGKVGEKSWSGDRDQDNPADHSHVELIEVMSGIYTGIITWPNGTTATCSLIM